MWFRIQSEGFIAMAQTGGYIPPNWGHQSSCCCFLSPVQISLLFLIYSLSPLPLLLILSLSLSVLLAPYHGDLLSLAVSGKHPCLHFKWRPCVGAAPHFRQAGEERERDRGRAEDGVCSWCFITAPHPDIWGRLFFFPHEHQRVINRINLRPNFLMITVLMYVNECSLLTHYRQFAWDTHNQTF